MSFDAETFAVAKAYTDSHGGGGGGGGGIHYSTDEQIVGTWIDGTPVYQVTRVLSFSRTIGTTWTYFQDFDDIFNITKILDCMVVQYDADSFSYIRIPDRIYASDSGMGIGISMRVDDDPLVMAVRSIITIQYIKS